MSDAYPSQPREMVEELEQRIEKLERENTILRKRDARNTYLATKYETENAELKRIIADSKEQKPFTEFVIYDDGDVDFTGRYNALMSDNLENGTYGLYLSPIIKE